MTTTSDVTDQTDGKLELPSAEDLRGIIEQREKKKAAEEAQKRAALEEEKKHQEELFLARKLTPDALGLIMRRVRDAAESGATEFMVGKFPSAWCTDGGREINAPEASWPETLQGFAKEFYEFWERHLKPKGIHLRVQVLDFPGGMPGDVGAFLSWKA